MSEQLIDFISAIIGITALFGFMGVGCAVWEITINTFENWKKKQAKKPREKQKYCKWNN